MMKKLKLFGLIALLLVLLTSITVYGYLFYTKPTYKGQIAIKKIEKETKVFFDEFGIPHIYAATQKDAMIALGYVHAQDRLWQMELIRRIAPGRLSEIFGTRALENDKFFIGLGIDEDSEKKVNDIDKKSIPYSLAMAYLEGINQYVEKGKTPIEFSILGIKKEKFTLKDVYNTYGYMAFSFAMAQKTDPLLTDIKNKFGSDYLKDLGINYQFNPTRLKSTNTIQEEYTNISKSVAELLDKSPIPPFIGSNSWVISPKKTKTGKVLFCNDPHISYSQPTTWYEAHLNCPDYEMYGYYIAGTPFPMLAHNRNYAYGLTMLENDDADFFKEENHPTDGNQYKTINGFEKYKTRTKTIHVKDSASVVLKIKETKNGPIMNDFLNYYKSKSPISLYWVYTQEKSEILNCLYGISHAKDMNNFHQTISYLAAPGLNIMYGDAKDNIAWFAGAKLYHLEQGVNPNFILNGTNGKDNKKAFINFKDNPKAINPKANYVYSSNNMPDSINGYNYPGYYLPEDRAKRITNLLDPKNDWDKTSASKMILDNTSPIAPGIVKSILSKINRESLNKQEKTAYKILKNWKGDNNLQSIAPTIYTKFLYFYLKNTYHDELGSTRFHQFLQTHVMKQSIAFQIKNENSPWWDNIATTNYKETQKNILELSFKQTIKNLSDQLGADINNWLWKRVHKIEIKHPLGSVAALRPFFNAGEYDIAGTNEVINNVMFKFTDQPSYDITAGPSTRRIIDFSDIENSLSILPTGQSGNPMSEHYDDQAKMYAEGKFRKMKLNKAEIIKTSSLLLLKPVK